MPGKPEPVASPDFTALKKICQDYIDAVEKDGYADYKWDNFIYEKALEALYGKEVWSFINDPANYSASSNASTGQVPA